MAVFRWLGIAASALSVLLLIKAGFDSGLSVSFAAVLDFYQAFFDSMFGWMQAPLESVAKSYAARLPVWWREGVGMFVVIVAGWTRAIANGSATLRHAAEFVFVSASSAVGTYYLDAAQTVVEAFFFGIAGAFLQLIATGLVSLAGNGVGGETNPGREVLAVTVGGALFVVMNAGFKFAGL